MPHDIPTTSEKNNLLAFKEQLHSILQRIEELDDNDKTEALTYVRKFIEIKPVGQPTVFESDVENVSLPSKRKIYPKRKIRHRKTNLFKCTACVETRETKRSLLKHMEFCHITTPISCMKCRRTLNSSVAYNWHIKNLCKNRRRFINDTFECPECFKVFSLLRTFSTHMKAHKRNNCFICNAVLNKRVQLSEHMLKVHKIQIKNTTSICCHCGKSFIKRQSLHRHLQRHYPLKIICNECGYINDNKEEYDRHLLKHKEDKNWKCSYCSDRFYRRQQYFDHVKNHNHYKCLTCNETFASKKKVYVHQKNGHTVQGLEPKFCCQYCPASFSLNLLYQKHLQKHKDKNIVACKSCKKVFKTERQYYRHCMTSEHDKKDLEIGDYICAHCGTLFNQKFKFNNHSCRFRGSKKRLFACSHCEYQSSIKANFERHTRLHYNDGSTFICDYCGKNFTSLAVLTDHIQYNHVQEKKFKCDQCNYIFKRKSELTRHNATHSDLRPHACKMCERAFKRLNHLHRHETTVHRMVKKTNKVQRLRTDCGGPVTAESKLKKENTVVAIRPVNTSSVYDFKPIKYRTTSKLETLRTLANGEFWYDNTSRQLPTINDLHTSPNNDRVLNLLILPTDTRASEQLNSNISSSI